MSCGVVTWFALFRPFGFTKFVLVHPSCPALRFIFCANAETEPETCSASPFATSFADFSMSP